MNASANATVAELLSKAAKESYQNYGNLTYLGFNATLAVLTIDPKLTDITTFDKSIDVLFSPEFFSVQQYCSYPISGQYGFANRLLFYCLLVISLLLLKTTWLSAAALGIAMTYSSAACVHAFALFVRYQFHLPNFDNDNWYTEPPSYYGDIDLQAIYPILVAGCIVLTPLLKWSAVLRSDAARNFKPVIILWGLMMFAALIPTMVYIVKGIYPYTVTTQATTCARNAAKGCTFEYFNGQSKSSTDYNRCNCLDYCGSVVLDNIPFRKNQPLQALLTSDRTNNLVEESSVEYVYALDFLFVSFIILQGILGLLETQCTQTELRNKIFLYLGGKVTRKSRRRFGSKLRYYFAKVIAGCFYAGAILTVIISPIVFIVSVVINEIETWDWPTSEEYDAVGQWAPWVAAAFAVVAAVVQENWPTLKRVLSLSIFLKGKPFKLELQDRDKDNGVTNSVGAIFRTCVKFPLYIWRGISFALHRVKIEFFDFKRWHNDPVGHSQHQPYSWDNSLHSVLKEVTIETPQCETCKKRGATTMYQCTDCHRLYCSGCWLQKQAQGARLMNEELLDDSKYQSIPLLP